MNTSKTPVLKIIIPAIILLFVNTAEAFVSPVKTDSIAEQKDSSNEYVLLIRNDTKKMNRAYIKAGSKVKIWDSSGNKFKGRIHYCDPKTIVLRRKNLKTDTIHIDSVSMIKFTSIGRKILITTAYTASAGIKSLAIQVYKDGGWLSDTIITFLVLISAPFDVIGTALLPGKRFRSNKFSFRIIRT